MKVAKEQSPRHDLAEMLADARTLSLVIARVKLFADSVEDKRTKKQFSALIQALSRLSKIVNYRRLNDGQIPASEQPIYIDGLPRWIFQIATQFGHYVNPESGYQEKWARKRKEMWFGIEGTIPSKVRDLLVSWRWKAELAAFRKISPELEDSQKKVKAIEVQLKKGEKSSAEIGLNLGLLDRFRILRWSAGAKADEVEIAHLEELKQKKAREVNETLGECEGLAAQISFAMKTAVVDCGDSFPIVFEECARAIDNEIKKELSDEFSRNMAENEILRRQLEQKTKHSSDEFKKLNGLQGKLERTVSGEWDKKIAEARSLIEREFLCLNAFEIEKQEDAVERWKTAVNQMNNLLKTAEENLLHGRGIN